MNNIKIENWDGHEIRFVEKDGEWFAVAIDVCKALKLEQVTRALSGLKGVTKSKVLTNGGEQEVNVLNTKAIYRLAFKSRKDEAEDFQDWVVDVIDELRKQSGLEGFQVFRMLDKEHQKEMMSNLQKGLRNPVRVNFMKANSIANKAVSNLFGLPKMIKKEEMSPDMMLQREPILEDTVELMTANDRFNLGIHVSEKIYEKYSTV